MLAKTLNEDADMAIAISVIFRVNEHVASDLLSCVGANLSLMLAYGVLGGRTDVAITRRTTDVRTYSTPEHNQRMAPDSSGLDAELRCAANEGEAGLPYGPFDRAPAEMMLAAVRPVRQRQTTEPEAARLALPPSSPIFCAS